MARIARDTLDKQSKSAGDNQLTTSKRTSRGMSTTRLRCPRFPFNFAHFASCSGGIFFFGAGGIDPMAPIWHADERAGGYNALVCVWGGRDWVGNGG